MLLKKKLYAVRFVLIALFITLTAWSLAATQNVWAAENSTILRVSSAKAKSITLKWTKNTEDSKYQVQRSNKKQSGYKTIATVTKNKYTDKTIKESKTYYYRIKVKEKGSSYHVSNVRAKVKVKGNYKHGSPYGKWLNDKKLKYVKDEVANVVNVYTDPSMSNYEKALIAHNWITARIYNVYTSSKYNTSDAYGLFKNWGADCWGFSKAYKALCDALGVPCKLVDTTTKGSLHEWNAVKISGKWYFSDLQMARPPYEESTPQDRGEYATWPDRFLEGKEKGSSYGGLKYNPKKYPKISSKAYDYDSVKFTKMFNYLKKLHEKG